MAEGHDEVDPRIALTGGHQPHGLPLPVGPRRIGVGLRIGDEPHSAGIEPAPIRAAAPFTRCARRRVPVWDSDSPLVVSEVVRRLVPFVIAPGGHVCGTTTPGHHAVEMPVDRRLAVIVSIREVPCEDHEGRVVRENLFLGHADRVVVTGCPYVGFEVEAKPAYRRGRKCGLHPTYRVAIPFPAP